MPVCPKCGKKSRSTEFCPHCGAQELSTPKVSKAPEAPKTSNAPTTFTIPNLPSIPLTHIIIALFVIGLIFFLFLFLGGLSALLIILGLSGIDVPTSVQLSIPQEATINTTTAISATLMDTRNNVPLANKTITFDYGTYVNATTDANGIARTNVILNEIAIWTIVATFNGDSTYLQSWDVKNTSVYPPLCADRTFVGECSTTASYYCDENQSLVFNCEACGCTGNLVCYKDYCMKEEERTGFLIDDLQNSMTFISHTYATGSGVIIAQDGDYTWVLTNRHVVQDADSISDVHVTTRDQQTIPASNILVAPFDMDLAIISVLGTYGTPVEIDLTAPIYQGQTVVALGSPLGIQGSVSSGIISNVLYDYTESEYRYTTLQTDAAINPGNSGGGLFLKSTGTLIGINTFIRPSDYGAEGLGFAIDVRSIDELPAPDKWNTFRPVLKCSDNTPYNSCSVNNVGLYCSSNGRLTDDCQTCGCDQGYFCPNNGECFTCPSGYSSWQTEDGEGFCCPPGTQGYQGGYCD